MKRLKLQNKSKGKTETKEVSVSTDDVTTHAVQAKMTISKWSARAIDKEASYEVATRHQASRNSGHYVKNLFPQGAESYSELLSVCNAARAFHDKNTLPGLHKGTGILPTKHYMEYMRGVRDLRNELDTALHNFLDQYPKLKKEAKKGLGSLYNEDLYPESEEIKSKFGIQVSIFPVPSSVDFRASIGSESEKEAIREQIDAQVRSTIADATKELWDRLYGSLNKIAEGLDRLEEPNTRFHASLLDNMVELCDLLPKLNIANDEKLEKLASGIKKEFSQYDPKEFRKDDKARKEARKRVKSFQNKMEGLMP